MLKVVTNVGNDSENVKGHISKVATETYVSNIYPGDWVAKRLNRSFASHSENVRTVAD